MQDLLKAVQASFIEKLVELDFLDESNDSIKGAVSGFFIVEWIDPTGSGANLHATGSNMDPDNLRGLLLHTLVNLDNIPDDGVLPTTTDVLNAARKTKVN